MLQKETTLITVYGLILNEEQKILLIQRAEHDTMPGLWEMPGGGLNFGEEPIDGVKREVQEECGITVQVLYPIAAHSSISPKEDQNRHILRLAYVCKLPQQTNITLSPDHSAFQWADQTALPQNLSGFLQYTLQEIKSKTNRSV